MAVRLLDANELDGLAGATSFARNDLYWALRPLEFGSAAVPWQRETQGQWQEIRNLIHGELSLMDNDTRRLRDRASRTRAIAVECSLPGFGMTGMFGFAPSAGTFREAFLGASATWPYIHSLLGGSLDPARWKRAAQQWGGVEAAVNLGYAGFVGLAVKGRWGTYYPGQVSISAGRLAREAAALGNARHFKFNYWRSVKGVTGMHLKEAAFPSSAIGRTVLVAGVGLSAVTNYSNNAERYKGDGKRVAIGTGVDTAIDVGFTSAGHVAGAGVGTAIGAVGGPVGAAMGGYVGGALGGMAGGWVADRVKESAARDAAVEFIADPGKHIDNALDRAADAVVKPLDDAGKFFGGVGNSMPKVSFGW